jgi:hypothetical protein
MPKTSASGRISPYIYGQLIDIRRKTINTYNGTNSGTIVDKHNVQHFTEAIDW